MTDQPQVTPRFKEPTPKRVARRRINPVSKVRAKAELEYRRWRIGFLAGALCERCGHSPATEVHHRRTRSLRGHLTLPANCARLCADCHRWVHANPAQAHAAGWLVWPGDPDWNALAARPDRSTP